MESKCFVFPARKMKESKQERKSNGKNCFGCFFREVQVLLPPDQDDKGGGACDSRVNESFSNLYL